MEKKQWVQHISGQGEKWELATDKEMPGMWILEKRIGGLWPCVPKSEYRLCDPPEVWRDVTEECVVTDDKWPPHSEYGQALAKHSCVLYEPTHWVKNESYRLRKVHLWTQDDGRQWAFIVEQKVS